MDESNGKNQNEVGGGNELKNDQPVVADDRAHAKAMAKAARDEARRRGKRITMSMFVIESL